jgi:hypothetical protein
MLSFPDSFSGREREVADIVGLLPTGSFLKSYVMGAAEVTDAPLGYHLAAGLSLLAQTVPSQVKLSDGTTNLNFYSIITGPSGARKTTAVTLAAKVGKAAGLQTIMEAEPGSHEGFTESLIEQSQQLILYPEFGDFLEASSTRKETYLTKLRSAFMKAYDGNPIGRRTVVRRDRNGEEMGGGEVLVENYRIGILGAVALPLLVQHTSRHDWTGGFLSRFYVVHGEQERDNLRTAPWEQPMSYAVDWMRMRLNLGTLILGCAQNDMSELAWKRYEAWYYGMEARGEKNDALRALAARLGPTALKLALLLAWDYGAASSGMPWQIELSALEPAIRMTELHYRAYREIEGNFADDYEETVTQMVFSMIRNADRNGRGLTIGEISKGIRRSDKKVLDALRTLKVRGDVSDFAISRPNRYGTMSVRNEFVLTNGEVMAARDTGPGATIIPLRPTTQVPGTSGTSNGWSFTVGADAPGIPLFPSESGSGE